MLDGIWHWPKSQLEPLIGYANGKTIKDWDKKFENELSKGMKFIDITVSVLKFPPWFPCLTQTTFLFLVQVLVLVNGDGLFAAAPMCLYCSRIIDFIYWYYGITVFEDSEVSTVPLHPWSTIAL